MRVCVCVYWGVKRGSGLKIRVNCADLQDLRLHPEQGEGLGRASGRAGSQGCALEGSPWTGIVENGSEGTGWKQDDQGAG